MKAVVLVSSVHNPEENIYIDGAMFAPTPENEIANDFDLIALEAAVSLKEAGKLDEVIVFSAAPGRAHVLKALAMGADRAVLAKADYCDITPESVVETALHEIREPDVIWMLGKLGVNHESHRTAQILAQRLGVPCFCSVCSMVPSGEVWHIRCEDDNGVPLYEAVPPFVVAADLRLAEPRYPSLPNIIRARRKPVCDVDLIICPGPVTKNLELQGDCRRHCVKIDRAELYDIVSGGK